MYLTLMNDFDKTFGLAFYNSFLKIACVLIYSLTKCVLEDSFKESCVVKNSQKYIHDEVYC